MKKSFFILLLSGLIMIVQAQVQVPVKAKIPGSVSGAVTTGRDVRVSLIDPAVTKIVFTTIKQTTGDKLRVSGMVKNIGGKDFESGQNQQIIQLWEIITPSNRRMLKQVPFVRLAAGQEIKIEYDLPALKPGNEFPPDYQVLIVYDPDILIDANKNNDDARDANNSLTKNPRN